MLRHSLGLAALAMLLVTVSSGARAPEGKKLAVVVGVNEYQGMISDLEFAENDAEELEKELKKAGYTVTLMTTRKGVKDKAAMPTAANIRRAVTAMVSKRGPADTVMVCLVGHGMQLEVDDPDGKEKSRTYPYFCPRDFSKAGISFDTGNAPNLVNLNWLFKQMEDCAASRKMVLVDACRNLGKATAARRYIDAKKVTVPDGVCALFSCSPGEVAYEVADLGGRGHGIFSHFVLEGLRGKAKRKDGSVTWGRLVEYVTENVEREVPKLTGKGLKQTPHQVTNFRGASPVLVRPAKEESLKGEKEYQRGLDHLHGRGVPVDDAAAAKHFKSASDEGHALAEGNYAMALFVGRGIEKDGMEAQRRARACFAAVKRLAEKGNRADAQNLLETIRERCGRH